MKLKSMKLSEQQADKVAEVAAGSKPEGPRYPWGLAISLENESMKKLGLSAKDLPVGGEVAIVGKARVVRAGSYESEGDSKREDAGLQLTDLAIELGDSDAGEVLFGGGPKD